MYLSPYVVLAVALVLPGVGQVLNREPTRGLVFAFFTALLGTFTFLTADPETSWVGQFSGGIFVHLMAALDAYRRARIRTENVRVVGRR